MLSNGSEEVVISDICVSSISSVQLGKRCHNRSADIKHGAIFYWKGVCKCEQKGIEYLKSKV